AEIEAPGGKLDAEEPGRYERLKNSVRPQDLATIIYTAGETGEPKGVMLSHSNIVSNVLAAASIYEIDPKNDLALSYLPLSHIFDRMMVFQYLYRGVSLFYAESIEKLVDNVEPVCRAF